jgi:hypothetical protein
MMLDWFNHLASGIQTAIVAGFFGLPTVFFTYRAGMRKQTVDASAQFSKFQMDAIAAREITIANLQSTISKQVDDFSRKVDNLNQQLGEAHADIRVLQDDRKDRDRRERELMEKIGSLTERLKHYDSCAGGSPCPFSQGNPIPLRR